MVLRGRKNEANLKEVSTEHQLYAAKRLVVPSNVAGDG
jgi:hypothetical protein